MMHVASWADVTINAYNTAQARPGQATPTVLFGIYVVDALCCSLHGFTTLRVCYIGDVFATAEDNKFP